MSMLDLEKRCLKFDHKTSQPATASWRTFSRCRTFKERERERIGQSEKSHGFYVTPACSVRSITYKSWSQDIWIFFPLWDCLTAYRHMMGTYVDTPCGYHKIVAGLDSSVSCSILHVDITHRMCGSSFLY